MLVSSRSKRLARAAASSTDDGSTLVSVLIIGLVLSVLALATSVAVVNTAGVTSTVRSSLQAQAAADAGIAAAIAKARVERTAACTPSAPVEDYVHTATAPHYSVTRSCPPGEIVFDATGFGDDGSEARTQARFRFAGSVISASPDEALVVGSGGMSSSGLLLSNGGDEDVTALMMSGNFATCNNITRFETDLVLLNGKLIPTNSCSFGRDVYVNGDVAASVNVVIARDLFAQGSVTLSNSTIEIGRNINATGDVVIQGHVKGTVTSQGNVTISGGRVDGDVVAGGSVTLNNATVAGHIAATGRATVEANSTVSKSLRAGGAVTVHSSKVNLDVSSAGAGDSNFYAATVGSITVAGRLNKVQNTTVTHGITSTAAGVENIVEPNWTVGTEGIRLAGTVKRSGSSEVQAALLAKTRENVAGLDAPSTPTAPIVHRPEILNVSNHAWEDFAYEESHWVSANYRIERWAGGDCAPGWGNNWTKVNQLTQPTVIDLRACDEVKAGNTNITLKTDVVMILGDSGKTHDFQQADVRSADGRPHSFSLVVPDENAADNAPTCKKPNTTISLYAATVDPWLGDDPLVPGFEKKTRLISGFVYTPCKVTIGSSGDGAGWNGQIYSGQLAVDGGGTAYELFYEPIGVPGFGPGTSIPAELTELLYRRGVDG